MIIIPKHRKKSIFLPEYCMIFAFNIIFLHKNAYNIKLFVIILEFFS